MDQHKKQARPPSVWSIDAMQTKAVLALATSAGCMLCTVWSLHYFLQADIITTWPWSTQVGWTAAQFWMLMLHIWTFPAAIVLLVFFAMIAHKAFAAPVRLVLFIALAGVCGYASTIAMRASGGLLLCGVFCFGNDISEGEKEFGYQGAKYAMNLIYFALCVIFASIFLTLSYSAAIQWWADSHRPCLLRRGTSASVDSLADSERSTLEDNLMDEGATGNAEAAGDGKRKARPSWSSRGLQTAAVLATFLVFYPTVLLACMSLPNMWTGIDAATIQEYQQQYISEHEDRSGTVWNFRITAALYLKLFGDVFAFYIFIYGVVVCAAIAHFWPTAAEWLSRPVSRTKPKVLRAELLFWLAVAGLVGYECYFWYFDHGWQGKPPSSFTHAERAARTFGQLANCVMGLLMLPTARNSVWTAVFGVPWEAMIRFHRVLGYVFLGFVTAHMLSWWAVYAENHSFPHDILAVPTKYHGDDFTIPLITIVSLVMFVLIGLFSYHYFRRRHFELFYVSHFMFTALFVATLWHAASAWYFVLSGLVLWCFDHILRFIKSAARVRMLSARVLPGRVVELKFLVESGGAGPWGGQFTPMRHRAGQYLFVNVPRISCLEWHPFTISSAPGDDATTVLIKQYGEGTFTAKLHELVAHLDSHTALELNVDGPYGTGIDYAGFECMLFVAGGIGVTPVLSHLRELLALRSEGKLRPSQRCKFVWVAQQLESFEPLLQDWRTVREITKFSEQFSLELYCTRLQGAQEGILEAYDISPGKPDIPTLAKSMRNSTEHDKRRRSMLFVCGPDTLVQTCAEAAQANQIALHAEIFEL